MTEHTTSAGTPIGSYTRFQGIVTRVRRFGLCPDKAMCEECHDDLDYLQTLADREAPHD